MKRDYWLSIPKVFHHEQLRINFSNFAHFFLANKRNQSGNLFEFEDESYDNAVGKTCMARKYFDITWQINKHYLIL